MIWFDLLHLNFGTDLIWFDLGACVIWFEISQIISNHLQLWTSNFIVFSVQNIFNFLYKIWVQYKWYVSTVYYATLYQILDNVYLIDVSTKTNVSKDSILWLTLNVWKLNDIILHMDQTSVKTRQWTVINTFRLFIMLVQHSNYCGVVTIDSYNFATINS